MTLDVGMVTIDCEDPGRLAEFWSPALEMEVLGGYGESSSSLAGKVRPSTSACRRFPSPEAARTACTST